MTSLLSQSVFAMYAVASCTLVVIMYGLGFWTAKIRNDRKMIINAEDIKVNSGATPVDVEHPDVQRIKRAHGNAIENAVPFFAIGLLFSLTSPSVLFAEILFGAFVTLRLLHALFYLNAKQPFRTATFGLGAIINLIMVVQVIRAAL